MKGMITDIQRFCVHDGPGIRTTVFLKGCPLRCAWCHNPETQSTKRQIYYYAVRCMECDACINVCKQGAHYKKNGKHSYDGSRCTGCMACTQICPAGAIEAVGRSATTEEVMAEVMKDKVFYESDGGLTLSGGEPMHQPEFAISLLAAAAEKGISTCMETCGFGDREHYVRASDFCNLYLWDVKDMVAKRHKYYTGVYPDKIIENLKAVDKLGSRTILRCILIKGLNMEDAHAQGISEVFMSLSNCLGVELLPYHPLGGSKSDKLGFSDNGRKDWIPAKEEIQYFKETLANRGVNILEL